jgi:hypothetical protein
MAWPSVPTSSRRVVGAFAWAWIASATPVFAAHPILTEDTGTQSAGKFELELGFAQARDSGTTVAEFGPQLSYGALDNLDLIVRLTWLHVRGAATNGTTQGFGDTGLDFKWRYPADSDVRGARRGGPADG